MKKLNKVTAMLLSFSVFIFGSMGMIGGEKTEADEPELRVSQISAYLVSDNKGALIKGQPVMKSVYYELLTGKTDFDKNNDGLLTRETAAGMTYEYLLSRGYEKPETAGNLSMYEDGIYVSNKYAEAVCELLRLSIYTPVEGYLMPCERILGEEAEYMIKKAHEYKAGEEDMAAGKILNINAESLDMLENMLACVAGAMLDQGCFLLEAEPDIKLASLSAFYAISQGIIPEEICRYSEERVAVMSQSDMKKLYSGMFARGEFYAFDPSVTDEKVDVRGDKLVFFINAKHGYSVTVDMAAAEPDGSVTAYCTVLKYSEYSAAAKVNFILSGGWASRYSIRFIQLSQG